MANIFSTYIPYHSLPDSIKNSSCRVVYLCRNPYDAFVSTWHFVNKARAESQGPLSCDDAFDMFCRGVIGFRPLWDHALGHWKERLEMPHKVLFLMYENLKEDITLQLKRVAKFMDVPFSLEEERKGVIEEISKLCSFNNLRELEVNKFGSLLQFENKMFFRRGEVGDWVNHLTPEMVQRLNKVIEENLDNSSLAFKTSLRKMVIVISSD
ncbi:Cytosolic sulfotransferase 15 [Camellia lanceoleosa]|uniref:Cytosolic sulfotransferase 15 n=1 Tax=Camellia lanceoleosa TaxID=1840588 RepID=A0ACC0IKC7_9ERIC|nr:Cytosolic sulfotransferase 15 [Camellia lanceoleosa]